MNINEFERTKPTKTYTNIKELKSLLSGYETSAPPDASNIWMAAIKSKVNELEDNFLKGS